MSSTEIHKGKLIPVKTITTNQELIDFEKQNNLKEDDYSSAEIFLNTENIKDISTYNESIILCDSDNKKAYCFYKNTIYKFENYSQLDEYDPNLWEKNPDGSITFLTSFYNGGTCFNEMLEGGIDEALNTKN